MQQPPQRTPAAGRGRATKAQPRRRLNAEARRDLILKAARRAFSETGDVSGTTIRTIAEKAGISEGLIYRHFESKEQLYIEAVVEPLRAVVDQLIETADTLQQDEPLGPEQSREVMRGLVDDLVTTFGEVLPLLGLVLFGDPKVARRFYRQNFSTAIDRVADAWRESASRFEWSADDADVSVRALMGMCLLLALEQRHNNRFDRERAVVIITDGIAHGFFPTRVTRGGKPRRGSQRTVKGQ